MRKSILHPLYFPVLNSHYIISYTDTVSQLVYISIIICHLTDPSLFPLIHSLQSIPFFIPSSVFYFHKYKVILMVPDQIYFSLSASKIRRHNPHTMSCQIRSCLRFSLRSCFTLIQAIPPLSVMGCSRYLWEFLTLPFSLSIESTNTSISATTSYNSGGIISPMSRRDSVSASLSSRCMGTSFSCAFSIIFSAKIPRPLAMTFGASSEGLYSKATACFTFFSFFSPTFYPPFSIQLRKFSFRSHFLTCRSKRRVPPLLSSTNNQ